MRRPTSPYLQAATERADPHTESPVRHVYINNTFLCLAFTTEHNGNGHGGGPVVEFDVSLAKCVHSVECSKWCNWK